MCSFDLETPVLENCVKENNNLDKDLPMFVALLLLIKKKVK